MRESERKTGHIHTLSYALAIPAHVQLCTGVLLLGVVVSSLTLEVHDQFVALIWLLVYRSSVLCRRQIRHYSDAFLMIKPDADVCIYGLSRSVLQASAWSHPVRFVGFTSVRFTISHAKPMEILIFCRYDQRSIYCRVIRHLTLFHRSSTTVFVHNERP